MITVEQEYYCPSCKKYGTITIADTGTGYVHCGICNTLLIPQPNGIDKFGRKIKKVIA